MARVLSAVLVLAGTAGVLADVPTDCRLDEIRGRWRFTLSEPTLGVGDNELNCTALAGYVRAMLNKCHPNSLAV